MPAAKPKIFTVCAVCSITFGRTLAFHRSAEAKGVRVRFCSGACYGAAKSNGIIKVTPYKPKVDFTCEACGSIFRRWPAAIRAAEKVGSKIRFCSRACLGRGRTEGLVRIHTPNEESNRKRSDGNRAAWGLPPHTPEMMALPKTKRARSVRGIGFNASQLRQWMTGTCARCGATAGLQLDHIICMAAGGKSARVNAQTLCNPCHKWKVEHVDKPLVRQQSLSGG